jgi:hypothetical protein
MKTSFSPEHMRVCLIGLKFKEEFRKTHFHHKNQNCPPPPLCVASKRSSGQGIFSCKFGQSLIILGDGRRENCTKKTQFLLPQWLSVEIIYSSILCFQCFVVHVKPSIYHRKVFNVKLHLTQYLVMGGPKNPPQHDIVESTL